MLFSEGPEGGVIFSNQYLVPEHTKLSVLILFSHSPTRRLAPFSIQVALRDDMRTLRNRTVDTGPDDQQLWSRAQGSASQHRHNRTPAPLLYTDNRDLEIEPSVTQNRWLPRGTDMESMSQHVSTSSPSK